MKIIFRILFICFFLSITIPASADEIVWGQPKAPKPHQNLHFEGNAVLDSNDVRQLQKALGEKGFYKGKIDGLWGPVTTQALLDYQAVHQQALTGTVTAGTLKDLGVDIHKKKKPETAAPMAVAPSAPAASASAPSPSLEKTEKQAAPQPQ